MEEQQDLDNAYYPRSKKRKVNDGEEHPIMAMPSEVLENIFNFITYRDLSRNVRKVNCKFKLAAEDLLNRSFRNLSNKLQNLTLSTSKAIESTRDDMEVKYLCRLLNLLEIIDFQQKVIMATIWRYVYNEFSRSQRSCMYAGLILDLYDIILHKYTVKPIQIYGPAVVTEYALPEEVKYIIHLTRKFCIHFDKVNEEPIKHALSASGSKIIDLLDCASYASKTTAYERMTGNMFSAKYCYYLPNTWFVAFRIPPGTKVTSRNHKQTMMHEKIRGIILAHTDMFLQQFQYEREVMVSSDPPTSKPGSGVRVCHRDVHDTFFYYGVSSITAADLIERFHNVEAINELGENDDFVLVPCLGTYISVDIDCPLAYAPYKFFIEAEDLIREQGTWSNGMLNFSVEFNYPGSYYLRLPERFKYSKRISTRHF